MQLREIKGLRSIVIFTQMFSFNFSQRYKLSARLQGHQEPILSLGVSKDGSVLASGGTLYAILRIQLK